MNNIICTSGESNNLKSLGPFKILTTSNSNKIIYLPSVDDKVKIQKNGLIILHGKIK